MWRPVMFLSCLVAALSGTPLRQAEAADDIARTVDEADSGDYDIEAVDGGVGDDAGETVLDRDAGSPLDAPAGIPAAPIDLVAPAPAPTGPFHFGPRGGLPPPVAASRRHAWLQCFRF